MLQVGTFENVRIQGTDSSNNTVECTFSVAAIDMEPPQISCPADVTMNTDIGLCTGMARFNVPTVSDNCGVTFLTLMDGANSLTSFNLGTTVEVYGVTDAAGLNQTCTFSIHVLDNEMPVIGKFYVCILIYI